MFFTLILENRGVDRVYMIMTANQYLIAKIEGLSTPPCTIRTYVYSGMDGRYWRGAGM